MKSSQLQIDNYIFKKICLEACDAEKAENWKVECDVQVLRHKDLPHKWFVELQVKFRSDKEKSPYVGDFKLAGLFKVAETLSDEVETNLVNVNGPSILYSAVRELVLHLTSRGPHPCVLLPSVTFIDRTTNKSPEARNNLKSEKEEHEIKTH